MIRSFSLSLLFWTILALSAAEATPCAAEDAAFEIDEAWSFTRTWKDARKNKAHFYSGSLPLRNVSGTTAKDVDARLKILDVSGKEIAESKRISFGTIAKDRLVKRDYEIQPAVEFAELVVTVSYRVDGKKNKLRFSSSNGDRPAPLLAASEGSPLEVRVLAHEVERAVVGRKKDKRSTATIRLRNMAAVPARQPTAQIVFDLNRRTRLPRGADPDVYQLSDNRRQLTVTLVLDEGELAPGESKSYSEKIDVPEYGSYSLSVKADWPKPAARVEKRVEITQTGSGGLTLGALSLIEQGRDTVTISLPVTNAGADIAADRLRLTIVFADKNGREVAKLTHTHPGAIRTGKTVNVIIPEARLPEYAGYRIAYEF